MHDANTAYTRAKQDQILRGPSISVGRQEIRPYLVGDSAYTLSNWPMKPFPERTQDPSEIDFNKELSAARVKVECAFGLLKSRWRKLNKRIDSKIEFVNRIVLAYAPVLHNVCVHADDYWFEPPDDEDGIDVENDDVIDDGDDVRQIILDYIHNL